MLNETGTTVAGGAAKPTKSGDVEAATTSEATEVPSRQEIPVDSYSSELWLAGYFKVMDEAAVQGGSREATALRKNMDFLRLRDVALHLLELGPGKTILDIGCADGATMIYCGLQGAKVYGQDLSPGAVATANMMCKRFGVDGEARVGDAANLTFPPDSFDAVITSDFVEHITDDVKVKVFAAARRVLKPGGVLVTKTPNVTYLKLALFQKRLRALMRLENPMKYVIPHTPGTDDPQHIGLTNRWALTKCLTDAGFMNYQFFYAPLRRFGRAPLVEVLSTEIPVVRDLLCEDLFCRAYKPIVASHFPG
jgi:2-polyprenyl-3-methyl-5-hydroxy-6-metoxy-1,4-benzoquinol methylase